MGDLIVGLPDILLSLAWDWLLTLDCNRFFLFKAKIHIHRDILPVLFFKKIPFNLSEISSWYFVSSQLSKQTEILLEGKTGGDTIFEPLQISAVDSD